jgi:diguanylate cyclase (GGDEF)-like protein/PAS domain S-box-containing protein
MSETTGDPVLEAVGYAAERFLSARGWEEAVPEVLQRLGRATDVSRVYIYENKVGDDGELVMDQRWEWCGPRVEDTMDREAAHDFPYEPDFTHLRTELSRGRPVFGLTSHFPASEQADMVEEGIVSNAVVPIFVGEQWWGYMGFDHCFDEHNWTDAEIDALVAAAGTLGATMYRTNVEEQLAGAERQLFEAEARYRALVEQIPAVLYIDPPDVHGTTLYVSPQILTILGVSAEDYLADPDMWKAMTHPDDLERAEAEYDSFLRTGAPESSDYRLVRPDGRVVWIHDRAIILRDENGEPFLTQGVMFDVTPQKEAEAQVSFMAYHDRLTGLPNRAMFEEHLGFALARAGRGDLAVAVLYMDLDNFKQLNDTRGHGAGDELLQKIAVRLQDATRDTDLVARQGGDEFLVLLSDIEREDEEDFDPYAVAESVATRALQALEAPFRIQGEDFMTSASIGISLYPMDASDASTLLMNADSAMYQSKRAGLGTYTVHGRPTSSETSDVPSFAARLREAAETEQWEMRYQPILDLDSGEMVALEGVPPPGRGTRPHRRHRRVGAARDLRAVGPVGRRRPRDRSDLQRVARPVAPPRSRGTTASDTRITRRAPRLDRHRGSGDDRHDRS